MCAGSHYIYIHIWTHMITNTYPHTHISPHATYYTDNIPASYSAELLGDRPGDSRQRESKYSQKRSSLGQEVEHRNT